MSAALTAPPIETEPVDDVQRSARGEPTWEVANLYPRQGEWTEEDYLSLDTNRLVEFSDGVLEVLPMPELAHQLLLQWIYKSLDAYVLKHNLGQVVLAPFRVRLRRGKLREPDVQFISSQRKLFPQYSEGADLVVEVVSPGRLNRERDLVEKRQEYSAAGIPEYWIVDPEARSITVLVLDGGTYRVHGEFRPGQIASSQLLNGFVIDVQACFDAARPRSS